MGKAWSIIFAIISGFIAIIGTFMMGVRRGKKDIEANELKKGTQDGLKIKEDIDRVNTMQPNVVDDILRADSRD
jgi:hypothetical protein